MISRDKIAEVLAQELDSAVARATDNDNGMRRTALQYYDGALPAADEDNDQRAAVSLDVADMVEAVYAQMAPAFEQIGAVAFEPTDEQDEAAAIQESEIVRSMIVEGRAADGGFVGITEAIKNALLMRQGTLALSIEHRETRTPEDWENVPETAVGDLIAPKAEGQRVEDVGLEVMAEEDAENPDAGPVYSVSLTRVDVDKRLVLQCVAPENFVTSSIEDRDQNQARFCADRIVTTRAQLIAMQFDAKEVGELPACDPTTYDNWLQRTKDQLIPNAAQKSTEFVEVWRCYALIADSEASSRAQRYRIYYSRAANKVLGKPVRVGRVCYALGNVIIYPHRMEGVSLFDKIGEIQELKTDALRNWTENLHKVNRPRLGVDETLANLADAMDATQDIIRVKGPNALIPIPALDAGPSVLAFLQYQDACRTERGGAALEMQTAAIQLASNQTAQGIERQYSTKEQLAAMMARTFAETALRGAYLVAHYLLRTQWGGVINAKLQGKWVKVDPSTWKARNGVVINVGQSQSERQRKALALGQVIQYQTAAMQSGMDGVLVDDSRMFNAAYDWIAAAQLRSPDRYIIDPSSEEAMAAKKAKGEAAQRQQQQLADVTRAQLMLDKYKTDVQALTDMIGQIVKAAIEEAKLTMQPAPVQAAGMVAADAAGDAKTQAQGDIAAGAPNA